jgi:hypothetical protein
VPDSSQYEQQFERNYFKVEILTQAGRTIFQTQFAVIRAFVRRKPEQI